MWQYIKEQYVYCKSGQKHCSIWYDVYIRHWRWTTVQLTEDGIVTKQGVALTASNAIKQGEES
jgi:hypothetical protein